MKHQLFLIKPAAIFCELHHSVPIGVPAAEADEACGYYVTPV